jgi:hypothetical protein
MLDVLKRPERVLKNEINELKREREMLLQANLHYCNLLSNENP